MHQNFALDNTSFGDIYEIERLRFALDAADTGTWDLDPVKQTIYWDKRCGQLYGVEAESELSYDAVLQIIHPDDRIKVNAAVMHALDYKSGGFYDIQFKTQGQNDKLLRWLHCKGRAYFNEAGIACRFSGIAFDITAQIHTAEKVAVAENMAHVVVKGSGVGLFQINLADDFIEYSPAFALILTGEINSHLNRRDFINHIHPDDGEIRANAYEAALKTGDLYYEARTIWNDGSIHWIRTVGNYIFDAHGKPTLFTGTVQNITEQRQKEQELKEAEERFSLVLRQNETMFRTVTSTSPAGLWMSDEEGKLTYLNKTLTDWTGMPYDLLLGHGWANAVVEDDRPRAAEVFFNAIKGLVHYDVDFRIKKGTGEIIWCRAAGDPYYREDGTYAGYVGFCMDINERIVIANNLKVSEERLRIIIQQAPVAIGLLNGREMIVETTNEAILRLWGKDESIIGTPLIEAMPEIKGQSFIEILEKVYDTGQPYYGYGISTKLMREGRLEELYFDFVYTPVRKADGVITGVMVVAAEVTQQVFARKAVEASEARFRSLIAEAPYATSLYVGRDLIIEMANDAMIQIWGKDSSIIGKPLKVALPELNGQAFLTILDNVFTSGVTYQAHDDKADLMVNGVLRTFYFNFTYKPLKNEKGEVYAVLNMAVDVSGQVQARQRIEESELFARSIIENSPVGKIVFIGNDMVISTVNEKMLEMLGRDAAIIGMPFMQAMPELISTPLMNRLRHVLATGETFIAPEEKIDFIRYGKPFSGYYNYIYKSLQNTAGQLYGVIVTATEVTAQVVARQKIEEAEEALRRAIELADLATWHIDLTTGILDYSNRLRTWVGFDKNEIITIEKAYSVVTEDHRHLIKESMTNALNPAIRSLYDVEYRTVNKITRLSRIIHAQGKAFFNEKGEAYKVSGTAQDVTKQREIQSALQHEVQHRTEELTLANEELFEANERLLRSNEELEQFAYVASHDLQEPLRKIRMFSNLLENQKNIPEDSRRFTAKIIQSAQRMSQLIQDLLAFSRLKKPETQMQPIELSEVCNAVIGDFELSIAEKGAQIEIGKLPVIEAVGLQMNQLFHNLLGNALKFTDPDRKPVIKVSSQQLKREDVKQYIKRPTPGCKYYCIVFADNGIGFDKKYAEQIFEVFKRLHGRDVYPGSGIGLALCRRIVVNHKGCLYAESIPGQGAAFHIILPDKLAESRES